jgi:pyridine nucleotide-disulfide oxidoreductase family protein
VETRTLSQPRPGLKIQTLVLLGAGHAHVQVIKALAQSQSAALNVLLVSPFEQVAYSGMLPGVIAGHFQAQEMQVSVPQLLAGTRVQWLKASCVALNALERKIKLSDGQVIGYDWLSINTGSAMERDVIEARLPGARTHAVFVRPMEKLLQLWPRLLKFAQEKPLNMAVIGGGAAGVEIALALQQRIPHGRVTLISGAAGVLPTYSPLLRRLAEQHLALCNITVIRDPATRLHDGSIGLKSGASLSCDMPFLAWGGHAPSWLQGSGLALTGDGYVSTTATLQSSSHPEVFAVGDVATRLDAPHPKSGVFAVRTGADLAHNLLAAVSQQALKKHTVRPSSLNLISLGSRTALMNYGFFTAKGAWVWYYKRVIDRRWMRLMQENASLVPPMSKKQAAKEVVKAHE